jgi:hypothetical protein
MADVVAGTRLFHPCSHDLESPQLAMKRRGR